MARKAASSSIDRISLERSAAVRKYLPTLNDGWILPDYVVGPENRGLHFIFDDDRLSEVANLSPIILYGDRSSGKTALAITLAILWSRKMNLRPLCFTTGDSFARDYAAAVEIDDIDSFRKRHRECKMLVIDDFDPLAAKPAAQDELSSTIDYLISCGHPAIVTMSRLPAAVKGVRPPLSSRLSAGYSLGLKFPGPETSTAIIADLIAATDKRLPANDLAAIAEQLSLTNPLTVSQLRDLVKIAAQQRADRGDIDLNIVSQLAYQAFSGEAPTLMMISKVVSKKTRVRLADMRGSTREANIVRARGLAALVARKLTLSSLQQIGEFLGGRDHSTVLHACRKTEQLIESDPELANCYRDILAEIATR